MSNIQRSILGSGRMTKNYRYEVNGRIIIDTVDLDTSNGNFGNIIDTVELVTGFGGLITKPKPIDPAPIKPSKNIVPIILLLILTSGTI